MRNTRCYPSPHPTPEPWVGLRPEAVALFQHPSPCLTHKWAGHPHKGQIYVGPHAPGALPSELSPELRAHLQKHFRGAEGPTKIPNRELL